MLVKECAEVVLISFGFFYFYQIYIIQGLHLSYTSMKKFISAALGWVKMTKAHVFLFFTCSELTQNMG